MILDPLQLVGVFYLGVIAQAAFLVIGRVPVQELKYFPLCFAWALLGLLPGKHEHNYDVYIHFFFTAGVFAIAFAWTYRKYLLDPINREVLLAWNLIFLYAAMRTHAHPYFVYAATVIALVLFVNLFFPFDLRKHMQTAMYAYFLCIVAGTAFLYLSLSHITFFFNHGAGELPDAASVFFAGASLLYITVNMWYVYELNPIPGKHESLEHRMQAVREDAAMMEQAYDESFQPLSYELFATAAIAALLAGNFLGNFLGDSIVIPLAVTLCHFGKRAVVVTAEVPEALDAPDQEVIDPVFTPDSLAQKVAQPQASQIETAPSSDT